MAFKSSYPIRLSASDYERWRSGTNFPSPRPLKTLQQPRPQDFVVFHPWQIVRYERENTEGWLSLSLFFLSLLCDFSPQS